MYGVTLRHCGLCPHPPGEDALVSNASWQESYCEFGVACEKGSAYTIVNHYGADGRRSDSVQTLPDGDKYVTTYSYGDVYIYTP